jgi:hypothetical protein
LAYHLWTLGWTDLAAACGTRSRKPFHEHVWLNANGIIVDITADQFGRSYSPVIVARRSNWHEAWKPTLDVLDERRLTDWRKHKGAVFDAYRLIMSQLHGEERS